MSNTDKLREFEEMWTPKKRGKGPSTFPQHLHALISENYVEKAKYIDDLCDEYQRGFEDGKAEANNNDRL